MTKNRQASVLVVGLAAMDFVFFVDEMPRLAEKYRTDRASIQGGGGGANAASAVARLGGKSRFVGRIGQDFVGTMIRQTLENEGVDCAGLKAFAGVNSSFASIYIDAAGERQIMSFRDKAMPIATSWLDGMLQEKPDAVLADTRWPDAATTLLKAAASLGVPGVIDGEAPVKDAIGAMLAASHVAFSNQGLRDWAGHSDIQKALADFAALSGKFVCATNGAEGTHWRDGQTFGHVPAFKIDVVDTLGAGDVWHGAFALLLGEGVRPEEAIRFANAAAAMKCARSGGRAAYPDRAEVLAFMAGR